MVEHSAVNRRVASSNLARGANSFNQLRRSLNPSADIRNCHGSAIPADSLWYTVERACRVRQGYDLAFVPQHEERGQHLLTDINDSLRVWGVVALEGLL